MGLQPPAAVVSLLQDLGYTWPEADEEKLFDLGGTWSGFAPTLGPVADAADAAIQPILGQEGEATDALREQWSGPDSPLTALRQSIGGTEAVGPLLQVVGGVVLALKVNVVVQLVTLAIEIAQAIITAPETFGASLLEIPVFKEITSRLVNLLISLATEQILG